MNIEKAIKRFVWRFSNGKFEPNKNDVDSLEIVVNWINSQTKENEREQQLFAKLYVHLLTEKFTKYQNLATALKEMDQMCGMSLSYYFDEFHFRFNAMKYWMYCEKENISIEHEKYQTKEDKELIMWHIKNDANFMKHVLGYWEPEKTKKSLMATITEIIHKYKNSI